MFWWIDFPPALSPFYIRSSLIFHCFLSNNRPCAHDRPPLCTYRLFCIDFHAINNNNRNRNDFRPIVVVGTIVSRANFLPRFLRSLRALIVPPTVIRPANHPTSGRNFLWRINSVKYCRDKFAAHTEFRGSVSRDTKKRPIQRQICTGRVTALVCPSSVSVITLV